MPSTDRLYFLRSAQTVQIIKPLPVSPGRNENIALMRCNSRTVNGLSVAFLVCTDRTHPIDYDQCLRSGIGERKEHASERENSLLRILVPRRSLLAHPTWRENLWRHRMACRGPHSVTSRHFAPSPVEWAAGERLGTRLPLSWNERLTKRASHFHATSDFSARSRVPFAGLSLSGKREFSQSKIERGWIDRPYQFVFVGQPSLHTLERLPLPITQLPIWFNIQPNNHTFAPLAITSYALKSQNTHSFYCVGNFTHVHQ